MIEHIHFRCPCCHGFPVTERPSLTSLKKPFWCEMHFLQISHDDIRYHPVLITLACTSLPRHSNKMMKPVNAVEIPPVIHPGQRLFPTRKAIVVGGMA